ncbi:MAG: sulfotransferase [Pirellulales bacterium]|nr:sulfotransferase [Pirellulales bacterium]
MPNKLPNLFLIGAMKSGTSTLAKCLSVHPEIFMSEPKETHFFVDELGAKRGWQWYRDLFANAGDVPFVAEASTTYSMLPRFAGVPERIARHCPQARIIYIVRDPVVRAISHYWHMVRWHGESRAMADGIRANPHWLDYSDYARQLTPYWRLFGRDRVYVLTLEEFSIRPIEEMARLLRWLGVDVAPAAQSASLRENETPAEVRVARAPLARLAHAPIVRQSIQWAPYRLRNYAWRWLSKPVDHWREQTQSVIEMLRPNAQLQANELARQLGRDFPQWTTLWGTTAPNLAPGIAAEDAASLPAAPLRLPQATS